MKAVIYITLKNGVLDPQGAAVRHSLGQLGFDNISKARQGKLIEIELDEDDAVAARAQLEQMCKQLLANTVIEDYRIELPEEEA